MLWRDTALQPKIGPLNASAVFPVMLWVFHWAWWTFWVAIISIVILFLIQRTGMSATGCLLSLRCLLIGRRRVVRVTASMWRKRCRW